MYPCIAVEHSYNCMVLLCSLFFWPSGHYTNLNSEFRLVATLTKASESISIDKSLVKHGFVIRYGGTAYIPKDLHPYNVPLLLVYDEGGYSYGKRINCDVTLQDNIYTVKMGKEGFASCFANNNYSRPTSGFAVQVYVA